MIEPAADPAARVARLGPAAASRSEGGEPVDPGLPGGPFDIDQFAVADGDRQPGAAADTIAGGIADDVRADYLACYDGDRFVESMRYVRRYPEELPALAELLPTIEIPVTLVNGRHDRVVPLANAEFLHERLPTSRLEVIDAGHFVWEERPADYASIILESIRGETTPQR